MPVYSSIDVKKNHKKVLEFFLFKTIPPIFHIGDALQIRSCAGSVLNTNREFPFYPQ